MSDLPPSKDKSANQPVKTSPNHRQRLRPDEIPIYKYTLCSKRWKDSISLGRHRNESVFQFLIIHDVKQAEKLLPVSFTLERKHGDDVIKVNNYRELEKHAPALGLKFSKRPRAFFRDELVITGVDQPPPYDYPHENGADDAAPPPYDSKNVPGKLSASKPDGKKT